MCVREIPHHRNANDYFLDDVYPVLTLVIRGVYSNAWGNSPTGVTAIIDSPNTVPNNDAMMSIVMNPPMSKTESILG
jgi:hypothetical protein